MQEKAPVALVTAASRGIGLACARLLSQRGYRLVVSSRSAEIVALAREIGATPVRGSVTDPSTLERMVQHAADTHGRIDAVVNNTGHPAAKPILELTDEDWHEGLDLLVLNVLHMARLVIPVMRRQGGGSIVNISTFGAVEPDSHFPVSSALRAALANVVKQLADEVAVAGVRINNILPGLVDSFPVSDRNLGRIPAGRPARVHEIASVVAFLVSPDASYVTGQNVRVDGGLVRQV